MAGHSRWANIKHKKQKSDAKRGKVFTKLVKEIMVAAKLGGSDIGSNPRLRGAVERAKSENLPADNIDRAIKKGAGELSGVTYEEGIYEGYAAAGVAVLVAYMTDNKNRTAGDVRSIFTKNDGRFGESGSVGWIFDKKGVFTFDMASVKEEALMEAAIEAGADDVVRNDDDAVFEVYSDPTLFHAVKTAFDEKKLKYSVAEISMIPKNTVKVTGGDVGKVLKLLDALEDNDDVQNVYANFDISKEDMEKVA
ncbi:MAG: YebC/PmpR family DNA-binding transcriptional regulator [Deltaproteobacteria bacterium]|nr:YebC/PmpR family DNA-binding transcriptional regulator [Deltaproteobacteria bacterium]